MQKTEDCIIDLLCTNAKHTTKTLAEAIGITVKGVETQLAKLKSQGRIERIGPAKDGAWKVNCD